MINCSLSNKLGEGNERFKSSEHVRWKGVQLKRRAGSRQRQGKVILRVISSSLQWASWWPQRTHPDGHTVLRFKTHWDIQILNTSKHAACS